MYSTFDIVSQTLGIAIVAACFIMIVYVLVGMGIKKLRPWLQV